MADHDVELIVFGDDDETVLFTVGTADDHANPYLSMPSDLGGGDVDLLTGKAMINMASVNIIDPQDGSTKQDRWFTNWLPTTDGHSALNRRRAVLWFPDTEIVIQECVIGGVSLNPSFAGFSVSLRDVRERARKIPAYTISDTCTVFPRGVLNGYGTQDDGSLLIPATVQVAGVTGTSNGTDTIKVTLANSTFWPLDADPRYAITDDMRDALMPSARGGTSNGSVYDKIVIWWRYTTGGDLAWKQIRNMDAGWAPTSALFRDFNIASVLRPWPIKAKVRGAGDEKYDIAHEIFLNSRAGNAIPADACAVEIKIQYEGPISEAFPLHIESTVGEELATLMDGDRSKKRDPDTHLYVATNPRIRYNATAVADLDIPCRGRVTKQIEDIRNAIEQICQQIGGAPALDDVGEVSPIRYNLPSVAEELPTIDDTNCTAVAGWAHPADGAVTSVSFTYERDVRIPQEQDPLGLIGRIDGLRSRTVTVERRAPQSVLDVMGEEDKLEINGWLFRALGGTTGDSQNPQNEIGFLLGLEAGHRAIDRFSFGGQSGFGTIRASSFTGLRNGDWFIDGRSWRPNYGTGTRGGNSLAQIVSLRRISPTWLAFRSVDAGPEDALLAPPTFGAPVIDSENRLQVTCLTVPSGADFEVQYLVSATEPDANSLAWRTFGRATGTGTAGTVPLPEGAIVWARGRSIGVGRRPSAWVNLDDATVDSAPSITRASLSVGDDGSAPVLWGVNTFTGGVRVYYVIHAPGEDPGAFSLYHDVDSNDGGYAFAADTVGVNQAITVELVPYAGFSTGAVTGADGFPTRVTGARSGRSFVTGAFWASPNNDGTADLSLYVEGLTAAFPVVCDFYESLPSGSPVETHTFEESGETVTASDYAALDNVKMMSTTPPAWWARLRDAAGGVTWVVCAFAPPSSEASLEMALKDFKVLEETRTTIKFGWTRGALLSTVKVTLSSAANPPTWPTVATTPTASLSAGTDFYTVTKPTILTDQIAAIFYGVMADGTTKGSVVSRTIKADVPAGVPTIDFSEVSGLGESDVTLRVTDPTNAGGELFVWTIGETPDPTDDPDGSYTFTETPDSAGPETLFVLTGGGNSYLLDDVVVPLDKGKRIFAEYVTVDGRTTGKRDFTLRMGLTTIVNELGELQAESIKNWIQYAEPYRPPLRFAAKEDVGTPEEGMIVVEESGGVFKYTSGAWVPFTDYNTPGAPAFFPAIVAGSITAAYLNADVGDFVVVYAENVVADKITAGEIASESFVTTTLTAEFASFDVLTALQATITDLSAINATFSGDLSGAGGTFSGDLSAASGTFVGDVSGADFTGANFSGVSFSGADFTGVSFTGVSFSGVDISGATGSFTGDVSGADFTGANFSGVSFSGVDFTGVDITGVTGTFSGTVSATDFTGSGATFSGAATFDDASGGYVSLSAGLVSLLDSTGVNSGSIGVGPSGVLIASDGDIFLGHGTGGAAVADVIACGDIVYGSNLVELGAPNSGGSGYRALVIPN